jgi:thiol-disulfide isomerase/thioredoxin
MNGSMLRRIVLVLAALGLFWIWGAASFLKALDPPSFAQQITLHYVSPASWSLPLAYVFIAVEAMLALALITFFKPRLAFLGSILLLLMFMGVTAIAWANGHTEGCGCFGKLAARHPREVLIEDSAFLLIAVMGFLAAKGFATPRLSRVLFPALLPLAVLLPVAGPSLPGDRFVTTFNPGQDLSSLAADDLRVRLDDGPVLLVLLGDSCAVCDEGLPRLEETAAAPGAPPIAAVFAGTSQKEMRKEARAWALTHVPPFAVASAPEKVLRQYYRKLPQTALLDNGIVRKVWRNRIPAWAEVQAALPAVSDTLRRAEAGS